MSERILPFKNLKLSVLMKFLKISFEVNKWENDYRIKWFWKSTLYVVNYLKPTQAKSITMAKIFLNMIGAFTNNVCEMVNSNNLTSI